MADWFEPLKAWVGRSEECEDQANAAPLAGLAATLDHFTPPWRPGEVPPLGHWCYFLPRHRQSELGHDGHARRGGLLPPVPLPRRMWAGGRITFHRPIRLGEGLRRRSTVAEVTLKQGRGGPLVFVLVRHEVFAAGGRALTEEHDIVYRGEAPPTARPADEAKPPALPTADWTRTVVPDPVLLFRYSALTFNGHRIHYDLDYCRQEEGYPGLVVHGPLTATLLADLYLRRHPGAQIKTFAFRALKPLFHGAPVILACHAEPGGARLSALAPDGLPAMTAELDLA